MSLESAIALLKSGVTGVTGVTASNHAAYSVTPGGLHGVTGVTESRCNPVGVTPVTPRNPIGVTEKPFKSNTVTPVTPVTPKNNNVMRVYRVHVAMPKGDPRPPRWITMLAPGADLTEATRSARARFGEDRVLEVREGTR